MKNLVVSYEVAKLAYEKGFDEDCIFCLNQLGNFETPSLSTRVILFSLEDTSNAVENGLPKVYLAPTHTQLNLWLWKNHGKIVEMWLNDHPLLRPLQEASCITKREELPESPTRFWLTRLNEHEIIRDDENNDYYTVYNKALLYILNTI